MLQNSAMSSQLQASGSPQTISSMTVEVPFFATVKEKLDKNGQLCGHLELQAGRELCQCPCGNHRAQPNRPQAFAHFLPRQFPVARLFELCPLLKAHCLLSAAWHAEFLLQRVEYPFTCLTGTLLLLDRPLGLCGAAVQDLHASPSGLVWTNDAIPGAGFAGTVPLLSAMNADEIAFLRRVSPLGTI